MLKKLISTSLVITLIFSLLAVGVSATTITGATSTDPNLIYIRDFEGETHNGDGTTRLAADANSTDWVWSYSGSKFKTQTIDGSTVMVESGSGGDSNVYRLPSAVTSGRFYLSMDIGYTDLGSSWDDAYITFYSEDYPADNGGGYTAFDGYGKGIIARLYGRASSYNASYPNGYLTVFPGSPDDGFATTGSKGVQEYLDVNKLHRLELVYNLDADYVMILLDGKVMVNSGIKADYAVDKITAIGLKTKKGFFFDNFKIATAPNGSFDYAIKNATSAGFDVEFTHSVHNFTTSNVSVDGVAATSVTKKNCDVYTVNAPVSIGSTIALTGVKDVIGNTINDEICYNQLANLDFTMGETVDTNVGDITLSFPNATFSKVDANTSTIRVNAAGYPESTNALRIGVANYATVKTDKFLFNFAKPGYLMGKLTVAYDATISAIRNVEPAIIFDGSTASKYDLPAFDGNAGTYGYNGTTVAITNSNTLYRVKNVLDFDTNQITAYLNDAVVYQGALKNPEAFANAATITGFRFDVTNKQKSWTSVVLDNVDIRAEYEANDTGIYVKNAATSGEIAEGNAVTFSAKIFNTTGSSITPYLLSGLFAGQKLIEADYTTATVAAGKAATVSFGATCDADTTKVQGFIWDSLTSLKPLTGVFSK